MSSNNLLDNKDNAGYTNSRITTELESIRENISNLEKHNEDECNCFKCIIYFIVIKVIIIFLLLITVAVVRTGNRNDN